MDRVGLTRERGIEDRERKTNNQPDSQRENDQQAALEAAAPEFLCVTDVEL